MECSPIVTSAGYFSDFMANVYRASEAGESELKEAILNCARIPIGTLPELVAHVRSVLCPPIGNVQLPSSAMIPTGLLLEESKQLCEQVLGIEASSAEQQAAILILNLDFIRCFDVAKILSNQWTCECAIAAGFKLLPERLLADAKIPLALLVLPLWPTLVLSQKKVAFSAEEHVDLIVRQWLSQCVLKDEKTLALMEKHMAEKEKRGVRKGREKIPDGDEAAEKAENLSPLHQEKEKELDVSAAEPINEYLFLAPRKYNPNKHSAHPNCMKSRFKKKFSYIKTISPTECQVMGRAVIDLTLRGSALLERVRNALMEVVISGHIPRRPRNRLYRMAMRLSKLKSTREWKNVMAMNALETCTDFLIPSVELLLGNGEPALNILLVIWLCSRRNIPTIITLPREKMSALSEASLWWPILRDARLPTSSLLAFGGRWWSIITNAENNDAEEEASHLLARHGVLEEKGEKNASPLDSADKDMEVFEKLLHDPSYRAKIQPTALRFLHAETFTQALTNVCELQQNTITMAAHVHAALEQLRMHRLLRENVLAKASIAWNSVMGCIRICAQMYVLFGQEERGGELWSLQRRVINHFAPDIYPWAYVVSTCNKQVLGFCVIGDEKKEEVCLTMKIVDLEPPDVIFCEISVPKGCALFKSVFGKSTPELKAGVHEIDDIFQFHLGDLVETRCEGRDIVHVYRTSHLPELVRRKRLVMQLCGHLCVRVPSSDFYDHAFKNVQRNLSTPLKAYVLHVLLTCTVEGGLPVELVVTKETRFDEYLSLWDRSVDNIFPRDEPCNISEEEVIALLGNDKRVRPRPPCPGILNISAANILEEIQRYTREEIVRTMCFMSRNGRREVLFRGVTDRPSAIAMVFAVLRGVDDRDFIRHLTARMS